MEQSKTEFSTQHYTNLRFQNSVPVEIERNFRAPLQKVWDAWAKADLIKQWWGPENFTCPEARNDFREGGEYLFAMKSPSGQVSWGGGIYKEIVPYTRIFMTDHFTDEKGNPVSPRTYGMSGVWPADLYVTLEFLDIGDNACVLKLRHDGIPKDQHDDCVSGWSSSLDKLQKLVESTQSLKDLT